MTAPVDRRLRRLLLEALYERDPLCFRCRQTLDLTIHGTLRDGVTLEHVVALVDGGADTGANLALSHRRCNIEHGRRLQAAQMAGMRKGRRPGPRPRSRPGVGQGALL